MAERAKRDRPARYPRAKNCMKCRNVFVGELWHKFCAICVEKVATEIAAEQLKGLWRQARVVIGRATTRGLVLGFAIKAARARRGATSLSIASHFPVMPSSYSSRPVRLPAGCARLATNPDPIGSERLMNTIGISWLSRCSAVVTSVVCARITSGSQSDQLFGECMIPSRAAGGEAIFDADVAAVSPSASFEPLAKSREPRLRFRIVLGIGHQNADAAHTLRLRARRERPRGRGAERSYHIP